MPKIISVLNQKGGSTKSTTTINLATALSIKQNKKVLVIDLDLQANSTINLIGYEEKREHSLADLLLKQKTVTPDYIHNTSIEGLKIIPSDEKMADVDVGIVGKIARESILTKCLQSKVIDQFDYIFCDNPPYISLISLNSLTASDFVLVPLTPSYFSLFGLRLLSNTVQEVKDHLNSKIKILGYLLNAYDKRKSVSNVVADTVNNNFPNMLFNTFIRVNTNFEVCPAEQKTIFEYEDNNGRGIKDYTNLSNEFLERVNYHCLKTKACL